MFSEVIAGSAAGLPEEEAERPTTGYIEPESTLYICHDDDLHLIASCRACRDAVHEKHRTFLHISQIKFASSAASASDLAVFCRELRGFLRYFRKEAALLQFHAPVPADLTTLPHFPADGIWRISPTDWMVSLCAAEFTDVPRRRVRVTMAGGGLTAEPTVHETDCTIAVVYQWQSPVIECRFRRPLLFNSTNPRLRIAGIAVDSVEFPTQPVAGADLWLVEEGHRYWAEKYPYALLWGFQAPLNAEERWPGTFTYSRDDDKWYEISESLFTMHRFLRGFISARDADWNSLLDWVDRKPRMTWVA